MEFDRQQAMRMDLSKMRRWGSLFSIPELCNLFKDGRMFGKLAEHILALEFDNLSLAREGGPYDLETTEPGIVEVKSLTIRGFDTSPSNMLGAGRVYDPIGHKARIDMIQQHNGYYILADNAQLPLVTFYPVEATDQLIFVNARGRPTGKRTRHQAEVFLDNLCLNVVDYESQLTIVKN